MNEEIKIIIKAVTDSAKKAVNDVSKELEGMSKSAKGASGKMGAAFKAIGTAAAVAVTAIVAIGAALVALGKNTLDIQKQFAKLNAAFEAAGASAGQAAETYNGLFRFLGESDKATEAAAHLAKITTSQQNLAEWTKIAQGVYATFGDSLPIEGLTEAANETLRVGQVTGTLADALNWAGVSEDEMNAKLAATNSLEEREVILRSTLNGLYSEAAEVYERNNGALIAYNESQAKLDSTMAAAGAATMPLLTALNNLGSAFFAVLKPALDAIIPPIATFINWIAKAIQSVLSLFGALTGKSSTVKAVGDIGGAAAGAAKNLGTAAQGAKNLGSGMGGAEKAAEGAAKAVEEAKKSTQGFDELNIVSSGKSSAGSGGSGGSSGGSGGGSSSPGYASGGGGSGLLDTASFGAEVQESEGLAHSLADDIKKVFSGLKDVFAPSIDAWSGAFETVKKAWNNAKPDFINGATQIKDGFVTLGTYLGTDFIPNVVNAFSTNLAPVIGDVFGFAIEEAGKSFSWLGEFVNTVIGDVVIPKLEFIKTVAIDVFSIIGNAWAEHGTPLLTAFSETFDKIRGHIDNFYNNVFKPIWDKVIETVNNVWNNSLKPLVDKVVNAFLIISTELLNFYNAVLAPIVDWIIKNVGQSLKVTVDFIMNLLETFIEYFSRIIGNGIDMLTGVIQFLVGVFTGDWEKAWEGIKKYFSAFIDNFKALWDFIVNLLDDIATWLTDYFALAFSKAWDFIVAVWDVSVEFFQNIWDGIVKIFEVVAEWFSDVFSKAWEGIKTIWNGAGEWFSDIWDFICNAFKDCGTWFTDKFSGAWEGIKGIWKSAGDWFSGIWSKITSAFSSVGEWFKTTFSNAWTNIKNVFKDWGSFFSGLWDKIKSTFSTLGTKISSAISDSVKSGINGVIKLIENTINKAIGLINGSIGMINKLPGVSVERIDRISLPRLAKGGIVDSATIAMIGEQGREAVVPLENNTGWMDKLADKLAARNANPTKVILKVGEKELGWATIGAINGITEQTGGLQLVL